METNAQKKAHYHARLNEYMTHTELIKQTLKERNAKGEIVDKIFILENATGHSYESVFGKYLSDDVSEVCLEDPYIREHYQVPACITVSLPINQY